MKIIYFVVVFLATLTVNAQDLISKVVSMNNDILKLENNIKITDSLISITTEGQEYLYIVENKIKNFYQADYYGYKVNFNFVESEGKTFGFRYTHILSLNPLGDNALLPIAYFCVFKEN